MISPHSRVFQEATAFMRGLLYHALDLDLKNCLLEYVMTTKGTSVAVAATNLRFPKPHGWNAPVPSIHYKYPDSRELSAPNHLAFHATAASAEVGEAWQRLLEDRSTECSRIHAKLAVLSEHYVNHAGSGRQPYHEQEDGQRSEWLARPLASNFPEPHMQQYRDMCAQQGNVAGVHLWDYYMSKRAPQDMQAQSQRAGAAHISAAG
jgi:hypothetical protein